MPVEKSCGACGKTFQVRAYLAPAKKYCSPECKHSSNRVQLICGGCGNGFWTWKSQLQYGHGKFCSKACMVEAKRSKAEPKPKRVFQPILKVCEVCGATFPVPPSRVATARWCSRKCQKLSPTFKQECSEKQQGEKSWRWAGGEAHHRTGYVQLKRRKSGKTTVRWQHTAIMIEWMCEAAPTHPFLILVDGVHRLHPDIEVHHIDRVRTNNVRSNLLAVTKDAHARIHHKGKKPEPWECWPSDPLHW